MTALTQSVAQGLFHRARVFCEEHIEEQYRRIQDNPQLKLTSDYYWSVLWLILPKPIDASPDQLWEAANRLIPDEKTLERCVVEFAGEGKERADVLNEVADRLVLE